MAAAIVCRMRVRRSEAVAGAGGLAAGGTPGWIGGATTLAVSPGRVTGGGQLMTCGCAGIHPPGPTLPGRGDLAARSMSSRVIAPPATVP